ncbi:MAG TPA: PAS domain S-box protein, partial [Longimicrobiaceae bacterium]|nr:PAS domain S-box protein [Longimicrobiaceae bacterium]
ADSPAPVPAGPSPAARYGAAAALTAAALGASLALRGWIGPNVFIFFIFAIVLSAWLGGRGPALLVAAAAIPLVSWFLLPPYNAPTLDAGTLVRFGVFAALAALIASMRESLHRARREAEEAAAEAREANTLLQDQAAELEMQAAELEQQTEESQVLAEEAQALATELEEAHRRLQESMEEQLAEAEAGRRRMEGVLEAIDDAFTALDRDLRYTYVNRTAEQTLGKPRAELLGRVLTDVFPAGADGPGVRMLRRVLETGVAETLEYESAVLGHWLQLRAYPWEGGLAVFYQDISERRRNEEQLSRLAAIVESTDDAIIGKTLEGVIESWNAGAARLYGYAPGEVIGRNIALLAPPDREDEIPAILARLGRGESTSLETVRRRRDGSRVDVSLTVSPVRTADGRVVAASTIARDVTAKQQARRAVERAAERIARLQRVTAAFSETRTPAEVADVVIGEGLSSLGAGAGWLLEVEPGGEALEVLRAHGYPGEVVERFRRIPLDADLPLAQAVRTGEPVFLGSPEERAARYPELQRDFSRLDFRAWASVPLVVEGRPIGGIGLSFAEAREFDAATREFMLALARQAALALERARLFEAERNARAEAEAANRAKFQFLTTMSHELRTPLNAIAGYVELLQLGIRGPVTAAQQEDLERIRRSQQHLLGLINDVLNFARIESGHVHFEIAEVPLDEALAEIEALILPQVQRRGLRYEYCRFDPAVAVRADRDKLQQVVLNLLSNAVKFTLPGGSIRMECEAQAATVAVRVRDTGVGIPPDKLATIFEPFVQVNVGYTRPSEGTGLGLSISRDLARLMGGDLTTESREGEGSVFTLTLPRAQASSGT